MICLKRFISKYLMHFSQIKRGGLKVLLQKISILLSGLWAIPLLFIVRFIKPLKIFRFGTFLTDRIGHFVADSAIYLAENKNCTNKKYFDIFWLDSNSSNQFWVVLLKRNLKVINLSRNIHFWNRVLPGGSIHHIPFLKNGSRDIEGVLEKSKNKIKFLEEENLLGENWLSKFGWIKSMPFVCLIVRDDAYLNQDELNKGHNWEYHNYRDSDIKTYVKASEWLAEQGVWVIRMGKIMKCPIPTRNPRIIDYAFHSEKSDFLDVWLFANCNLCISTATGADQISDVFRKPLLIINYLPIKDFYSWSNAVHVPKHLKWKENGNYLNFSEHLKHSYYLSEEYVNARIEIVDLNENEILDAVRETWLDLQGSWIKDSKINYKHEKLWNLLRDTSDFKSIHGYIHHKARFGEKWLESMPETYFK